MLRPIHTSDIYRTISYDIYRTTVVRLSYDIVRQSYDCRTISYSDVRYLSYDKYRTISYDCRTISYDSRTISYDSRTTVVRYRTTLKKCIVRYLSYDILRYRTSVVRMSDDSYRNSIELLYYNIRTISYDIRRNAEGYRTTVVR